MLYLVSIISISADDSLDNYESFIVEAENEENLAAAIVADRIEDNDITFADLDKSIWYVRELGEEFHYTVNLEYVCNGERLSLI